MKTIRGRITSFVLAFCMVFTGMFNGNVSYVQAEESSIVTKCLITLEGKELTENTKIENGNKLKLNFEWELADGTTESEYKIKLDLYGIEITTAADWQDITKEGEVVGKYMIDADGYLHLNFDENAEYFGEKLRYGGINLDGVVNIDKSSVDDHDPVEIGWSGDLYKVIFSYGDPKSRMEAVKELSGGITTDAEGNFWQEYKVTLTAYDNNVKDLCIKDVAGSNLSNISEIQVAGTVYGGEALQSTYADMDSLNAALVGTTLLKDESLVLTYKMQVAKGIYEQNVSNGTYQNHIEYSYETNEQKTESDWSNIVEVAVNRPTISKTGVANANQDEITWSIKITLGDFSEDGFETAVKQVLDTVGAGLAGAGEAKDIKSLFVEDSANPGTYVATYTTKVEYEGLNSANNTVQVMVDDYTYTANATVPLEPVQWISKSCQGKQDGYLVWDVYLTPPAGVTAVTLEDFVDNYQNLAKGIWVDDVEILTYTSERWEQCWNGTYTEAANGIIKDYSTGLIQYSPLALRFADDYIQNKANDGKSIKITYKTVITSAEATEVVNTAKVSYYDSTIEETTSQTAIATWVDDGSTVSMSKEGWEQNNGRNVKYEMLLDYDKYKYLDDARMVNYQFEVVDVLPEGLTLTTYLDEWTLPVTIKAGNQYWQGVDVPYTVTTADVTVDGVSRQQVTFKITLTEEVITELKGVRDNSSDKPSIKITMWTDVEDVASLVREGSKTFTNTAKSVFDGINLEDTTSTVVNPPSVVRKTESYNVKTGVNYYTVYINEAGLDLSVDSNVLSGTDSMGNLVRYIFDTVKVEDISAGESNAVELEKGEDYQYTYSAENNQLFFSNLPDETPLKLTYQAKIQLIDGSIADGDFTSEDVKNIFQLYGFNTDATKISSSNITSVSKANLDGWAVSAKGSITIQKYWTNGGQMVALKGALFDIYNASYDATQGKMVLGEKEKGGIEITDDTGVVTVKDLPLLKIYALVETKSPYGFGESEPYYFVLRNTRDESMQALLAGIPEGIVNEFVGGVTVLYENEEASGDLVLQKNFDGLAMDAANKDKISFSISPKVGAKDTYTLSDFTETNGTYTLTFADAPAGEYTITESRTDIDGYTFKEMTYAVSTDGVQISSGGETQTATETVQMKATVKEDKTTTVAVTNTYGKNIDITVTKTWDHGWNTWPQWQPTSITIGLRANGTQVKSKTVTATENWSYTFTDLPPFDETGKDIEYTVIEDNVDNYSTTITGSESEGFVITNTYAPNTTSVTVTKVWEDDNNRDGIRPPSVQIQLYRNDVAVSEAEGGVVTLPIDGKWTYTWSGLAKSYGYGMQMQNYVYTVEEVVFDSDLDYTSEVRDDGNGRFTITNSHTPETTKVIVTKVWDDADNQDGKRPPSITVNLYSGEDENMTFVNSATITAGEDGKWSYTFENLPKYERGAEIKYSVTENDIDDYKPSITGDAGTGFVITNKHEAESIDITITKVWEDEDNHDGKRPNSVTVNLMSGEGENKKLVASKDITEAVDGIWSCTFENLPVYENGSLIDYTLEEEAVQGYETDFILGLNNNYTLVNTHTLETTSVSGSKTWKDNDDQDGIRPDSITINLLADGIKIDDQIVEADNQGNWEYSFTGLPKYRDGGVEIVYTITEDAVAGYETPVINGYDVTNKYTPETISVSGVKTWDDANDQDGKRPDSIIINLLADGTEVDEQIVEADNQGNWEYSFPGLPKYRDGGVEIVYTITEDAVENYTPAINGFNITNSYTPDTTNISGSKTWADNDDQDGIRPDSITINLLADGVKVDDTEVTATDNWSWNFTGLTKYKDGGVEIVYTITEEEVDGYTSEVNGYNVTNTHTPETTSVSGVKTWADNDDQDGIRPDSITINLLADGTKVDSKEVKEDGQGNWEYNFTGLPKYRDGGVEIVYTITEEEVDGYTSEINGYNVTNTHTPETTSVSGVKTWDDADDQDGIRPDSITINLLADGVEIDDQIVEADANGDWKYSFTDLPKYKDGGTEIIYTITEDTVAGYEAPVINGYDVTNKHTPGTISVSGVKTWVDNDDQDGIRPDSITINLLADGTKVDSKEVKEDGQGNWEYNFTGLPKYRDGGVEIVYTITEDAVENYTSTIVGFNVTNSHTPGTVNVAGSKTWNDEENQDGKRPDSITINLLADGVKVDSQIVEADANGNWSWSFTELSKYEDGEEIEYTITEEAVEGYTTVVNGYNVTNSYTPETTNITVTKTWDDANNQDGIRPSSITIRLLADGSEVKTASVRGTGNTWTYTFTDLPKYKDGGTEIVYTITEDAVVGYETPVINGFDVTNKHVPETIDISGTKTWDDADDQDGKRPEKITINLLANGTKIDSQIVEADANGSWSWSFTELSKYEDGEEIEYTITEEAVEGYTTVVNGYNVTNSYTPETTNITVTKTWDDANNQDGIRPSSITIRLLADGNEVKTATLNGTGNAWTYEFTGLPKYKNGGTEIVYTITEDAVTGYETPVINGFEVTNKYTPETIDIDITKTWVDGNNQDGIRPATITVHLYADGQEVKSASLSGTGNDWTYTFTDLPKYHDGGKEIKYTVTEDTVTDYKQAIDGNAVNGFTITNTHAPETTNIHIEKKWNDADNQDGKRPDTITVKLLKAVEGIAGTTVVESKDISAEIGWKYSFKNLPVYENGKKLTWSVEEVQVANYAQPVYVPTGTEDGEAITITNTYTPETTNVKVIKTWDDADNQDGKRPTSVTVNLLANGVEVDNAIITEAPDGTWTYEFTGLPKYADGREITYTVTEDTVTDYSTSISGYNITNKYTPGKTSVTVTKVWDDEDNQDGLRPTPLEIVAQLKADGTVVDEQILNDVNNWTYTWTELDVMKDGNSIAYTVDEKAVPVGYEKSVSGSATHGYTITNKHIPMTTEVEVTKEWDDADNQDGKRPSSIKVQLYADNVMEGTAVLLNGANGWTYQWTGLAKKNAGMDITYTVKEVEVPEGYTTDVTGNMTDGYVITNTHIPEVVEVKGSKTWADNNNLGSIRPNSITVYLLVNGTVKETKTVTAADNWSWDFGNLPKYEAGKEIEYTITEDAVPDYSAKVEGFNITNITPAVYGSILVTKKLVGNGMDIKTTGDTFYVALYADNDGTMLVSEVKSLNFEKDSSSTSVEFTNVEVGKTYYVRECDANGKALLNGRTKDGIAFVATFENDNKVALELKGEQAEVTLINTFEELPEDYYISGELQITKKLLGKDGAAKNSSEIFYAGIFEDAAYTKLSTLVSDNIVELKLNGNSQTTENVLVTIRGTEQTLYITEVDMNGVPVEANNDFAYMVTVDSEKVVFDLVNDSAKVTITNREVEEVLPTPTPTPEPGTDPTPTPTPEPGTDPTPTPTPTPGTNPTPTPTPDTTPTPTPVPGGQTSPKTGDSLPIEGMLWLFLVTASVVGMYSFGYSRNKRKVK